MMRTIIPAAAMIVLGLVFCGQGLGATPTTEHSPKLSFTIPVTTGAYQFREGDEITIQQIRVSTEQLQYGSVCEIIGTYKLSSHDSATLQAEMVAAHAQFDSSPLDQRQTKTVVGGSGKFDLTIPVSADGSLRVSLLGDDKLPDGTFNARNAIFGSVEASTLSFPNAVPFDAGTAKFPNNGDHLSITSISGTAGDFEPNQSYLIQGTYRLDSHSSADLGAYLATENPDDSPIQLGADQNHVEGLGKGAGKFAVILTTTATGNPHLVFWPAGGGESFGCQYFGSGENLRRTMPAETPDFPFAVPFGRDGATFAKGDDIQVTSVRGTSPRFNADNDYLFQGSYTLASAAKSNLTGWFAATSGKAAKVPLDSQSISVAQTSDKFALKVASHYPGQPLIGFSHDETRPTDDKLANPIRFVRGGMNFGEPDPPRHIDDFERVYDMLSATTRQGDWQREYNPPVQPDWKCPYILDFLTGYQRFLPGDSISISEVRGTSGSFVPGSFYKVKGQYNLASQDSAVLAVFITAVFRGDAHAKVAAYQKLQIFRGSGKFTLILPDGYWGYPHIAIYPAAGGESLDTLYFGTGRWVWGRELAKSTKLPEQTFFNWSSNSSVQETTASYVRPGGTTSVQSAPMRAPVKH